MLFLAPLWQVQLLFPVDLLMDGDDFEVLSPESIDPVPIALYLLEVCSEIPHILKSVSS